MSFGKWIKANIFLSIELSSGNSSKSKVFTYSSFLQTPILSSESWTPLYADLPICYLPNFVPISISFGKLIGHLAFKSFGKPIGNLAFKSSKRINDAGTRKMPSPRPPAGKGCDIFLFNVCPFFLSNQSFSYIRKVREKLSTIYNIHKLKFSWGLTLYKPLLRFLHV